MHRYLGQWRTYNSRYYRTGVDAVYNVVHMSFYVGVPLVVLVINALLIREVRRATSHNAAANLGLQQQSSSSHHSAVPTVMLVATSLFLEQRLLARDVVD